MFFSRRTRRKRQREAINRLQQSCDALADDSEFRLCHALIETKVEQLEAAEAINDEATARELMAEIRPLLVERDRLIARESMVNRALQSAINEIGEISKCQAR